MARNLKMFFDSDGSPRARGPSSEKLLMAFLETDVQGSDHICHDLMEDISAVEDSSADSREFVGNAHSVIITADGVTIECTVLDDEAESASAESASNEQTESKAAADDKQNPNKTNEDKPNQEKTDRDELVYKTGLKHFREVLEDWEAFILDDQSMT